MNRSKKKNFDAAWSTYTQAFREYWLALPRSQRSEVVNSSIVKCGKRKFANHVMENFEASETLKRSKIREQELLSSGVIQEVAETLVGGPERLRQAVGRGYGAVF